MWVGGRGYEGYLVAAFWREEAREVLRGRVLGLVSSVLVRH